MTHLSLFNQSEKYDLVLQKIQAKLPEFTNLRNGRSVLRFSPTEIYFFDFKRATDRRNFCQKWMSRWELSTAAAGGGWGEKIFNEKILTFFIDL